MFIFVHEVNLNNLSDSEKLFCEFFIGFVVVLRLNIICCAKLYLESN